MILARFSVLPVVVMALTAALAQESDPSSEMRDWKSADGQFTTAGALAGFIPGGIELRKPNGTIVKVPLAKLSKEDQGHARTAYRSRTNRATLGLAFSDLAKIKEVLTEAEDYKTDASYRAMVKSYPSQACLVVTSVLAGGPAEAAGIQIGDLVTHINGQVVRDPDSTTDAMMGIPVGGECKVKVLRREVKGKSLVWKPTIESITTVSFAQVTKIDDDRKKAEARRSPLRIVAGGLAPNVIGIPELSLSIKNTRDADSVAFSIEAECYNSFDEKVVGLGGSHVFGGISQTRLKTGKDERSEWALNLHRNTTRAVVRIVRVKFSDGSEWNVKDGEPEEFTVRMKD